MAIPSFIEFNDTNSDEKDNIKSAVETIFLYGRISSFFSPITSFGYDVNITFKGFYDLRFQEGDPNRIAGSFFSLIRPTTAQSPESDIIPDSLENDAAGLKIINIGSDYTHSYDSIDGNNYNVSMQGTMVHELTHALIIGDPVNSPIYNQFLSGSISVADRFLMEQVAVFAENALWGKEVGEHERVGHLSTLTGSSTPQTSYISTADSFTFEWLNGHPTFRTEDGRAGLVHDASAAFTLRTYFRLPFAEGEQLRNYITMVRDTGAGMDAIFDVSRAIQWENKASLIISQSIVDGGTSTSASKIGMAQQSLSITEQIENRLLTVIPGYSNSVFDNAHTKQSRGVFVSNERYADRSDPDLDPTTPPNHYIDDTGPVLASNGNTAPKFYIFDFTSSKDTLLLGGGSGVPVMILAGSGNDFLSTGSYYGPVANRLDGGGGSDILYGSAGKDALNGGAGNDIIIPIGGADEIDGGDDTDLVSFHSSGPVSIDFTQAVQGTGGPAAGMKIVNVEYIVGSTGTDSFTSLGGMVFWGNGGDDVFTLSTGDIAVGGAANDTVNVKAGATGIRALMDGGRDTLAFQGSTGITFDMATGMTAAGVFTGFEVILGADASSSSDNLTSLISGTTINGRAGNDILTVGSGVTAYGGNNDDRFIMKSLTHTLVDGGNGINTIDWSQMGAGVNTSTYSQTIVSISKFTMSGFDDIIDHNSLGSVVIDMGGMNDRVNIQSGGNAVINGEGGTDTVSYLGNSSGISASSTNVIRSYGFAADTLSSVERIIGSNQKDTFLGGQVEFWGEGGDDTFVFGSGGVFHGGSGVDTVDFKNIQGPINFSFATISSQYDGVERVNGTAYGDTFQGTIANEDFFGWLGNDTVRGGSGTDRMFYDLDRATNDGFDIISISKIFNGTDNYYQVRSTRDYGESQETDYLYGIESLVFSDGTTFALNGASWINPFYT